MILSGPESGVLVALLAVALLVPIGLVVWVLLLQARVRRLEAHRPAGDGDVAEEP